MKPLSKDDVFVICRDSRNWESKHGLYQAEIVFDPRQEDQVMLAKFNTYSSVLLVEFLGFSTRIHLSYEDGQSIMAAIKASMMKEPTYDDVFAFPPDSVTRRRECEGTVMGDLVYNKA